MMNFGDDEFGGGLISGSGAVDSGLFVRIGFGRVLS